MLDTCKFSCYSVLIAYNVTNPYKLNTVNVTYTKSVSFHNNNPSTAGIIEHDTLGTKPTVALQFIHRLLRFYNIKSTSNNHIFQNAATNMTNCHCMQHAHA